MRKNLTLLHQDDLSKFYCEQVGNLQSEFIKTGVNGFFNLVNDIVDVNVLAPNGFLNYRVELRYIGLIFTNSKSKLVDYLRSTLSHSILDDKPCVFVNTSKSGVLSTISRLSCLSNSERELCSINEPIKFNEAIKVEDLVNYISICVKLDYLDSLKPIGA